MRKFRFEYSFTAIYLILGFLWILFSDSLLGTLISDHDTLTRAQTYKGWFYVAITAFLFYYIIRKHLIKLRNAELKAREGDRLKTAFLQNISHEVRTPMNGIIGFAGLLQIGNLTEEQRNEYLTIITDSSYRLLDLFNQMLDISMIESGTLKLNSIPVRLNQIMEEMHSKWLPHVNEGVQFSFSKGLNDDDSYIISDEDKLNQLLNNLVGNAIKFTEKGRIRFGYTLKSTELEFFIEDTGIGISGEYLEDIFKRFQKVEINTTKFYDGAGLGLTICKSILELMNGKIEVESMPGSGSVFRFTIPYVPVGGVKPAYPEKVPEPKSISGLILLVAEDELMNYRYIEELLIDCGIELIHATNGETAVEICKSRQDISLVLMDIRMPVMDGFEATRLIKEFRPELPVVAQSAYLVKNEMDKTHVTKFDDYLSKPFMQDELMQAIKKHALVKQKR